MLEPFQIAHWITQIIFHGAPYASKIGEKAAQSLSDALLRHLTDKSAELMEARLKRRDSKPDTLAKLESLKNTNDDPELRAQFFRELRSLLEQDPAFASELSRTVKDFLESGSDEELLLESIRHLPPAPRLFVGRSESLEVVKKHLTEQPKPSNAGRILVVTGWPGVGKTTLTAALAHDLELRGAFPDGVLWTSLDQSPDLHGLLGAWGRIVGAPEVIQAPSLKIATDQLAAALKDRRMLLIVDDIWEVSNARPFLVGGPRCATLLTTRLEAVARHLASRDDEYHRLPVLSEDASLTLLRAVCPEIVDQHPEACRELAQELEGLPLALLVAGRLLRTEFSLGWGVANLLTELRTGRQVLDAEAPIDRTDLSAGSLPTVQVLLHKSTERLDPRDLERFAQLGTFVPKPATFDLEALKFLWETDDPKPTVRTLVSRGLLEPAGGGRFYMHGLLIAHAASFLED